MANWLLWRQIPELRRLAVPGRPWLTATLLAFALAAYVFGRVTDLITFEAGGVYGVGLAILHAKFGPRAMAKSWFPLLYLAFAIPPPNWIIDHITAPLKQFVSLAATDGLQRFGIPVAREGVTLYVAQYQLLVKDACSGMNSIEGLTAVGLLYVYLMRGSFFWYSIFLTALVIPIAIAANIVRIAILVLLTYYFGEAVAQSFIHIAAGFTLFATSLLLVFAIDSMVFRLVVRARRTA